MKNACILYGGLKRPWFYCYLMTHSISRIKYHTQSSISISNVEFEFHVRNGIWCRRCNLIYEIELTLFGAFIRRKVEENIVWKPTLNVNDCTLKIFFK